MSFRLRQVDQDQQQQKPRKSNNNKLPKCFKIKVDISKVDLLIIKRWIETKINLIIPNDDIIIDYIYELLLLSQDESTTTNDSYPDIKSIQLQLVDFLGEDDSIRFCEELWNLLIEAQDSPRGIPKSLLPKQQHKQERVEKEKKGEEEEEEVVVTPPKKTNYNRSRVGNYNVSKSTDKQQSRESYRTQDKRDRDETRYSNKGRDNNHDKKTYRERDDPSSQQDRYKDDRRRIK
ncbi:uncharacterized protein J8A68_003954 [[Candida] subhashii]|uniref:U1 small nuclear ribonucleoprotein component SNU71 n=1 Tax=[Candida] subhashii TaxID=561895 RepID=A0A8J5QL96_9ASCO|nr:uncharacterized protein J8A68_003954 [[Candida] subhashii]KAG7662535.1 hypothetical protein J8A68_003954 [[Candida] subhashii]